MLSALKLWPLCASLYCTLALFTALDAHVAHLHFTAQQRQYTHRQAEHLQVGEWHLGIVERGDARLVQFQPQPREQAPADVAVERQLDVGLVACQLADLVFVVVGIEEVGQGKAQRHNDQQQPEYHQPQDFAERFHGRVLVVRL
uniref:Secreted protein n=1 Tax=Steinernema glaseri TaxID=37863 RepID=A0A1I7YQQ9_9BILA